LDEDGVHAVFALHKREVAPPAARELSPGADFVSKLLKARQRVCLEFGLKGQVHQFLVDLGVKATPSTWSLDEPVSQAHCCDEHGVDGAGN